MRSLQAALSSIKSGVKNDMIFVISCQSVTACIDARLWLLYNQLHNRILNLRGRVRAHFNICAQFPTGGDGPRRPSPRTEDAVFSKQLTAISVFTDYRLQTTDY